MGVVAIFAINFLLQSKWHHRTIAVFGFIMWPFMSLFWVIQRVTGKKGAKSGDRPLNTLARMWYQFKTNTSYVLRKED